MYAEWWLRKNRVNVGCTGCPMLTDIVYSVPCCVDPKSGTQCYIMRCMLGKAVRSGNYSSERCVHPSTREGVCYYFHKVMPEVHPFAKLGCMKSYTSNDGHVPTYLC